MRVTHELLERYESCKEGFDWFDSNYSEGEELMTILTSDPLPPPDFIVWGLKYFDVSDEERTAANLLLHNTNSERVFGSWYVSDSNFVVGSHDIANSQHVGSSEHVTDSSDIHESSNIEESNHIFNTTDATAAEYTYDSSSVQNSSFVSASQSISWSQFIKNSLNIEDGVFCSLCKNSALLTICEMVEDSSNCCVCFGLKDKSNYLFNQPSTYDRVEEVRSTIMNLLMGEPIDPAAIKITSLSEFFKLLPNSVLTYLKSLPEYGEIPGASFSAFI